MSQDVVADALNQIMNAKRAKKTVVTINRHSKVLIGVLEIAKKIGYIANFKTNGTELEVEIGKLNECRAIKPRFYVKKDGLDKYMRRYLPSRNMGVIIVSTNQGLMTHHEATEKHIGGSLVAYFY